MECNIWEELLCHIKDHPDNWVLVCVTAVLALFTWLLFWEARKTRKQNITPQISIIFSFIPNSKYVYMKIANTGKVDAKNVKILCKNDNYYDYTNEKYKYSERLSRSFDYLPVEQFFSFKVGYYGAINDEVFNFDVYFQDVSKKVKIFYPVTIIIHQMDESLLPKDELNNIKNELKTIGTNIAALKGKHT